MAASKCEKYRVECYQNLTKKLIDEKWITVFWMTPILVYNNIHEIFQILRKPSYQSVGDLRMSKMIEAASVRAPFISKFSISIYTFFETCYLFPRSNTKSWLISFSTFFKIMPFIKRSKVPKPDINPRIFELQNLLNINWIYSHQIFWPEMVGERAPNLILPDPIFSNGQSCNLYLTL